MVLGSWYDGQLLDLARDLATRLLPAFDGSPTGLHFHDFVAG